MKGFVQRLYNWLVRPRTPRKIASFNGVPVRGVRLFDTTEEFPDYEAPLVAAIRQRIRDGDDVVVVGGGRGVSSTVAAQRCGPEGSVVAFEGSQSRVALARETLELSRVDDVATVEHAVVGEAIDVAGEVGDATVVSPTDLPACDVLVLDCEGAEVEILDALEETPRVVIVETHDFLGTSESDVRDSLNGHDLEVVERGVEDEARGVFVLTAVSTGSFDQHG